MSTNGEEFPTPYRIGAVVVHFFARTYFRVKYVGLEHVPTEGGAILAPNHASFLDPPLIACRVERPMVFVANEMFFNVQPLGKWMRQAGGYPVSSSGESTGSMKEVLRALKNGRLLGLFPEGTRSWDGSILPPMAGVGLLVAATDVPVIPIHVDGAFRAWPRHRRFPFPRKIVIRFGPPVDLDELRARMTSDRKHRRDHQRAIAQTVMEAIESLAPRQLSKNPENPKNPKHAKRPVSTGS